MLNNDENTSCPCMSGQSLNDCCAPFHHGLVAPSALTLMRSRYSAFALGLTDYIQATTHPAQQGTLDMQDIADWSRSNQWLGLKIHANGPIKAQPPMHFVEFTATYKDAAGQQQEHHERSLFVRMKGRWYFIQP